MAHTVQRGKWKRCYVNCWVKSAKCRVAHRRQMEYEVAMKCLWLAGFISADKRQIALRSQLCKSETFRMSKQYCGSFSFYSCRLSCHRNKKRRHETELFSSCHPVRAVVVLQLCICLTQEKSCVLCEARTVVIFRYERQAPEGPVIATHMPCFEQMPIWHKTPVCPSAAG